MAVFHYVARDADDHRASGTVTADTPREARERLRDRGLRVTRIAAGAVSESLGSGSRRRRFTFARSSQSGKVLSLLRELSTLLSVGVPLLQAIDSIALQHSGTFAAMLHSVRERIAGGASLADAMLAHPAQFDQLSVAIARTGEHTGTLEICLDRLADYRDHSRQIRGKLATALIYPSVVVVMSLCAGVFLMIFVVPSILEPLIEMGRPLPWPTRIVRAASEFIVSWGWLAACGVALFTASLAAILRSTPGRRWMARLALRMPVVGTLLLKQSVVRICVSMSTMLGTGIPFAQTLSVAREATTNVLLRDALLAWERSIIAGGDIAASLEETHVFPTLVVQIFAVGQQSGQLEVLLDRLARDYDRDVSQGSQRLAAILEPLLILGLALLVLLIALATMLPILESGDVLH